MALPIINCSTQFGQPKKGEILKLYLISSNSHLKSELGEERLRLLEVICTKRWKLLDLQSLSG